MANRPQYFAALSISSLDSEGHRDDISENGSNITQTELYQQLSYIEEVASNFFIRRPVLLHKDHGVFSELEYGINQEFELRVSDLKTDSVLSLSILCIPDCITAEDAYSLEKKKLKGIDFQPLEFRLHRKEDKNVVVNFKPVLYNGEYCITLSSAHGLSAGVYVMTVAIGDDDHQRSSSHRGTPKSQHIVQTVRVTYNVLPTVRAVPIEVDKPVSGIVAANEIACYRFVSYDPSKVVGIQLISLATDVEQGSDPDLYITNKHDGLVAATKEKFVWKSTNVGSDRVDIFPDDVHLPSIESELSSSSHAGNRVFVISVFGYKETNSYQLLVTLSPVVPIKSLVVPHTNVSSLTLQNHNAGYVGSCNNYHSGSVSVVEGEYSYYSLRVDQGKRDLIAVSLSKPNVQSPKSPPRSIITASTGFDQILKTHCISLDRGRAVYVSDDLQNFIAKNTPEYRDDILNDRPVIVYISATTKYPSEDNFTWKTSAVVHESNGTTSLAFIIDCDEWKYSSDTCYFSVTSSPFNTNKNSQNSPASDVYTLALYRQQETDHLDGAQLMRYNMFNDIFGAIDGNILSHKDRSYQVGLINNGASFKGSFASERSLSNVPVDDYSLTYQEIDYVSFLELLKEAGAVDGQIFYDLGCGSGKAVVAAALSGIRFVKCVGVEILPTLSYCASEVINCVIQSTQSFPGSPERNSYSSYNFGNESGPGSPVVKLNKENLSRLQKNKGHNRSMQSIQEQKEQRVMENSFSFSPDMKQNLLNLKLSVPLMEIRHENILEADWSDADFVFVSSLCFSDRLIQGIVEQGVALKTGAILLTLKLPERYESYFDLQRTVPCKMSCGRVNVFVLVRRIDSFGQ